MHTSLLVTQFTSRVRRWKRLNAAGLEAVLRLLWERWEVSRWCPVSHCPGISLHLTQGPDIHPFPGSLTFSGASWSCGSQFWKRPWGLQPAVGWAQTRAQKRVVCETELGTEGWGPIFPEPTDPAQVPRALTQAWSSQWLECREKGLPQGVVQGWGNHGSQDLSGSGPALPLRYGALPHLRGERKQLRWNGEEG